MRGERCVLASPAMSEPTGGEEVALAVTRALERSGVTGTVVVVEGMAELHGAGPVVAIDLGDWAKQWQLLPPDMRDRRADHAAERLIAARAESARLGGGEEPRAASGTELPVTNILIAIGAVAALALVGTWLVRSNFFGRATPPDADTAATALASAPPPLIDPASRARVVCDAARKRLYAGSADLGVDIDGWLVELWLARADGGDLAANPALAVVRDARDVGAKMDLKVSGTSEVLPVAEPPGVVVRLGGGFVPAFFTAEGRGRFVALAEQLADAVDADHAALFARCAHLRTRDVGSLYLGRSPAGAAATVLYAQGAFTDPPLIAVEKLGKAPLTDLARAASALDRAGLEDAMRASGGRVVVREPAPKGAVSVAFGLGGPTRAQHAAKSLAGRFVK